MDGEGRHRREAPDTVEGILRDRLSQLLGGWRGAVEAGVPTVAFILVWAWAGDLVKALVASGIAVLGAVVLRVVQRQTVRYALSSVLATAIAAAFALRTGRAEDAFLPSILWNLAQGAGFLVSVLVRWPVMGFMVAAADPRLTEDPEDVDLGVFTRWRRHPGMVRVCSRITLLLAALMLGRAAIMLPLYAAGQVALLGTAKLVLGWPTYLLVVGVIAAMLLRGNTPLDEQENEPWSDPEGSRPRRA
ncbi:Protein of unknown function [Austwickia chelonae]|uniref:DUF3159 domain-containing protein n=1 Tax=Austwickia chelonae NBRC 105200 TaxID=1184607 RepID=K6VQF7_9MICO|nr:DUF3159 domain-containing protein [Austwickia chelonae]GAB77590.1 hypothetical protein AUCHE_05_05030 [Austwickia chelonae NBRC 105200]SEW13595.1 Protein of unknown function [Austwickia chelonae]